MKKVATKKIAANVGSPEFSPAALGYVRAAGWTPTRRVPVSAYEKAFAVERVPLLPKVKSFLRQFGGLIVRYATESHQPDVLDFLAERAVVGMGTGGIGGFEKLIGIAPLCPIGHYQFGTCVLLMSGDGRVFGGSDESVSLVGSTGTKAICNILCGGHVKVLRSVSGAATESD